MKYKFTASFQKEGKWYVGRCLEFSVTTQGKTLASAKKNLIEAVELFLEDEPKAKKYAMKKPSLVTTLEFSHG